MAPTACLRTVPFAIRANNERSHRRYGDVLDRGVDMPFMVTSSAVALVHPIKTVSLVESPACESRHWIEQAMRLHRPASSP
jgi:hypothetical protein